MQSAWVGEQTRTVVPDKAVASIDLRLVPESDPDHLKKLAGDVAAISAARKMTAAGSRKRK